MKRIGIDFHAVDSLFQGSRTHILELFSRVIELCPDLEFYLFLENHDAVRQFSDSYCKSNVHLIHMPYKNPVYRLLWQLPNLCARNKIHLIHTQYILPFLLPARSAVTIHDVLFESHPEYFSTAFRIRSKLLMRLSAHRASHVFTVSDFSKQEMISRYDIHPDRISVIHNGVDGERFAPAFSAHDNGGIRGLPSGEYILSVGRIEPRKNHLAIIESIPHVSDKNIKFVFVGQRHFGFSEVFSRIDALNVSDRVIFIDDVKDDELPVLYRNAKLFVYPTWAEGFGMPPIEAMASGVPVISSNTTALPEVAGEAAVLIDPSSCKELAEKINHLLESDSERRRLIDAGLRQSMKFKWSTSAQLVSNWYRESLQDES